MSSLAALVGFLLLSAPGLVYEAVREKCRPAIEHTPLREAGRVTLASAVFTAAAAALLALDRLVFPWMFPDPDQWAASASYRKSHWLLASRTVVVGVVLACLLAGLVAWFLHRHAARMRPESVLWLATNTVRPKPHAVSTQVRLLGGEVYTGFLRGIDFSGDPGTRAISLDMPLLRGGVPLPDVHRLVLPLSQAEVIGFTFHGTPVAEVVKVQKRWCFRLRHP